jgi:hypothetical protein
MSNLSFATVNLAFNELATMILQKIRTVELDGKTVKLQIVSDLNVEMALM